MNREIPLPRDPGQPLPPAPTVPRVDNPVAAAVWALTEELRTANLLGAARVVGSQAAEEEALIRLGLRDRR